MRKIISVVIPAFNEEKSIGKVISEIDKTIVKHIIVVNNNSTDKTHEIAKKHGAIVVFEKKKGYGYACLKGIEKTKELNTDIIVFMDGDYSDFPTEIKKIITPILNEKIDFVVGSRIKGKREKGSLTIPQIFGNWLATRLIKLVYKKSYTDLGPFRAIKATVLEDLNMRDKTYGWTIEMQIKIIIKKYKFKEISVNYRNRIGVSKVSGTIKGTIFAGIKIIFAVFRYRFTFK
ncbi:MAG: UDP-glucose--dolichyl-phosphate glucosyltransferase [Crocinitomicaceae bacterium]|nr:UDP-glucose--dolichyl-phosphate glucosyltransferase [Crocinitomicaceae bacterium]|tara:strand:- start:8902 stop:9597 length:696 start_codon:yes stop_codon:yes gene_type:complete